MVRRRTACRLRRAGGQCRALGEPGPGPGGEQDQRWQQAEQAQHGQAQIRGPGRATGQATVGEPADHQRGGQVDSHDDGQRRAALGPGQDPEQDRDDHQRARLVRVVHQPGQRAGLGGEERHQEHQLAQDQAGDEEAARRCPQPDPVAAPPVPEHGQHHPGRDGELPVVAQCRHAVRCTAPAATWHG